MREAENPYASPQELGRDTIDLIRRQRVRQRLFLPGIALLLSGLFGIAFAVYRVLAYALPYIRSEVRVDTGNRLLVLCALMLLGSVFCIIGGIQMMRVRSYGICMTAAILMFFPCTSPLILLGSLVGIWILVVLLLKDTRAAFTEVN